MKSFKLPVRPAGVPSPSHDASEVELEIGFKELAGDHDVGCFKLERLGCPTRRKPDGRCRRGCARPGVLA